MGESDPQPDPFHGLDWWQFLLAIIGVIFAAGWVFEHVIAANL